MNSHQDASLAQIEIRNTLAKTPPFDRLSVNLSELAQRCQFLRYHMGQTMLVREKLPTQVMVIYQGEVRIMGHTPSQSGPISLRRAGPGEIVGWASLVRGLPCDTVIASTEVTVITISAAHFLELLNSEPNFAQEFRERCSVSEVFELLNLELQPYSVNGRQLRELACKIWPETVVLTLTQGQVATEIFDPHRLWLVSRGRVEGYSAGQRLVIDTSRQSLTVEGMPEVRLLGLSKAQLLLDTTGALLLRQAPIPSVQASELPYASEQVLESLEELSTSEPQYPYVHGKGLLEVVLACLQMLSQHLNLPFRRDALQKVLTHQIERAGGISLPFFGLTAELLGLQTQIVELRATDLARVITPAIIRWESSLAIIYEISSQEVVLAIPETGIVRRKTADFAQVWGSEGQVLLVKTAKSPKERFSLRWFLPLLQRYRRSLIEVLVASLIAQIFGLANPLLTQTIIDKVIGQNSLDTLYVLSSFLVVVSILEVVLISVRTFLFVDTTNRIDLALGSQTINHLLRLPLRYFEQRPVGELSTRVGELEKIRQFLTGTALTVVLDAIFSVVYIVVMLFYSWFLTLIALGVVPLLGLITVFCSPIIRNRLRERADRNAEVQSYLVEVLSGIQTVKAQRVELQARWRWQERYANYISASFKTVMASTIIGSVSDLLNKISGLALLSVGAYLVLQNQLTLGQLIAFRIIAGYTTSPLLRLVQTWQKFQETALSIEILGDILDSPQEFEESSQDNIPMPSIQGAVKYEKISFSFAQSISPQLKNISVEFSPGSFIGIVGQSGSGKSTMLKLLYRFYEPSVGRIFVDDYDINKVELYSLRRQIGIVMQDTFLFEGSVRDNIALSNPDAPVEDVVRAAKIAAAHEFIMNLPQGYNTRVGGRGSKLSGGQRQRIAIAQVVLQSPQIIVLDEATSALDYHTEREVCTNLVEAFRGRTVFCITHRLSTVRDADRILMMEQGSIVEQGSHDELMALRARYFSLYQQQDSQS